MMCFQNLTTIDITTLPIELVLLKISSCRRFRGSCLLTKYRIKWSMKQRYQNGNVTNSKPGVSQSIATIERNFPHHLPLHFPHRNWRCQGARVAVEKEKEKDNNSENGDDNDNQTESEITDDEELDNVDVSKKMKNSKTTNETNFMSYGKLSIVIPLASYGLQYFQYCIGIIIISI